MEGTAIRLDGITKRFGDVAAVRGADLEVAAGEIVALLGPSGCGKSTLLRQVSGLDLPTVGSVVLDGTAVTGIDQRCAVAFQEPRLLPWRSLFHNIEIGLPRGTAKKAGQARVDELLE